MKILAFLFGTIYLAAGVAGFVPALVEPMDTTHGAMIVDQGHGMLLGWFAINDVHNIVHLAIGLWGLLAVTSYRSSVVFFRSLAILYGALGIMGLFPATETLFGMAPLHGNDVWLHLGTAIVAAFIGWGLASARQTAITYKLEAEDERRRAA